MKTQPIDSQSVRIQYDSPGKTTVSPEVLLTIAQLTTLSVKGVSRMSNVPGGVNRLLHRGVGDGIQLDIQDDVVSADIYIILNSGFTIREVSREIQINVSRAVTEMVGMQVGRVNVHIDDIDFNTGTNSANEQEV